MNPDETFHVVQITDCHLGNDRGPRRGRDPDLGLQGVLGRVVRLKPDLCIATGDLSDDGSYASYDRFADYLSGSGIETVCLPGNHDDVAIMRRRLCGNGIRMDECVSLGNWQIHMLDSTVPGRCAGSLSAPRLSNLAERLDRADDAYHLIALHHPVLPSGSAWMDHSMLLDNPHDLLSVLQGRPRVRGLIWGHIHQDFAAAVAGIPCWASPSTWIQFQPGVSAFATDDTRPGLRHFTLKRDGRLSTRVERVSVDW